MPSIPFPWQAAVNVGNPGGSTVEFDEASLLFGAALPLTRLAISTAGYGHAHFGPTRLEVRLLPSGPTVWSTTVSSGRVPMAIDVSFPLAVATGVTLRASPPQSNAFHAFAPTDTVHAHTAEPTVEATAGAATPSGA